MSNTDETVVLTFRAPRDLRDRIDLAVQRHPGQFPDRAAALRAGCVLLLRTLDLIVKTPKLENAAKIPAPPQSEDDLEISEVFASNRT